MWFGRTIFGDSELGVDVEENELDFDVDIKGGFVDTVSIDTLDFVSKSLDVDGKTFGIVIAEVVQAFFDVGKTTLCEIAATTSIPFNDGSSISSSSHTSASFCFFEGVSWGSSSLSSSIKRRFFVDFFLRPRKTSFDNFFDEIFVDFDAGFLFLDFARVSLDSRLLFLREINYVTMNADSWINFFRKLTFLDYCCLCKEKSKLQIIVF